MKQLNDSNWVDYRFAPFKALQHQFPISFCDAKRRFEFVRVACAFIWKQWQRRRGRFHLLYAFFRHLIWSIAMIASSGRNAFRRLQWLIDHVCIGFDSIRLFHSQCVTEWRGSREKRRAHNLRNLISVFLCLKLRIFIQSERDIIATSRTRINWMREQKIE